LLKKYLDQLILLQGQRKGLFPAVYSKSDVVEARMLTPRNVPLDENHSHFLLTDDGSENKFGAEIDFRTRLEKFISNQHVDPEDKESCEISFYNHFIFYS
jgi:hypothetical protein